jgi:tetratricopeptide (TPR) repeat protein
MRTDELEAAKTHFQASLDISSRLGDSASVATAQLMLGNIALRQNRLDDARSRLRESLDLHRQSGSSRSLAHVLESLAAVALSQGQVERAQRLAGAAGGLRQRIGLATSSPDQRDFGALSLESLRGSTDANPAWLAGAAMSRDDAIGYALGEFDPTVAASG